MSQSFEKAFSHTLGLEGKYSNNPNDSGGETMWGITKALAVHYGYSKPMRDMPISIAKHIYKNEFWDKLLLEEVAKMSHDLAVEMFDTAVNMGGAVAVMFLQSCLNSFNRQGKLYSDIKEDGAIGRKTIETLHKYFASRGAKGASVLLKAMNCLQGARYIELGRRREANEEFTFGWFDNRVNLCA
jgi:lysozyme family protein